MKAVLANFCRCCCAMVSFRQVFSAFSCQDFPEYGKSYLRADFRVECYTTKHEAFKIYAAIMICICEF